MWQRIMKFIMFFFLQIPYLFRFIQINLLTGTFLKSNMRILKVDDILVKIAFPSIQKMHLMMLLPRSENFELGNQC